MSRPTNDSPPAFTRGMKSLIVGAIVSAIPGVGTIGGAIVGAIVGSHSSVAGWRGANPTPLIVLSLILAPGQNAITAAFAASRTLRSGSSVASFAIVGA